MWRHEQVAKNQATELLEPSHAAACLLNFQSEKAIYMGNEFSSLPR